MGKTYEYIFVALHGAAVMGFLPSEIADFEENYIHIAKPYGIPYWTWFNMYFADDLEENVAYAYDTLWRMDKAYTELELIKNARGIKV